jgi:hypothetical protein
VTKRKAQSKSKPVITLSDDAIEEFMEKCQNKATWLLEMCKWINAAREPRLAAMAEWARINDRAELVLTHFLAMEADAKMRAAHTSSSSSPPASMETSAVAAVTDLRSPGEAAAKRPRATEQPSAAPATPRPSTPPRNPLRSLVNVSQDLVLSREKRQLSPGSASTEEQRMCTSMRRLVNGTSPARERMARQVHTAVEVLDGWGSTETESGDMCKMRARLVLEALQTPPHK